MPGRAHGRDPLARAARTQRVGRIMIAIAIMTCLCITPPVLPLIDRVLPGLTLLWIVAVWLLAIIGVAVAVERRPGGDDIQDWRDRRP